MNVRFILLLCLLLTGCEKTVTEYVQVEVEPTVWVGIEYAWAGKPLNNDVRVKIKAGWDCELLLEFPVWLPANKEQTAWLIVASRFYLCTLVGGVSEPFRVPMTLEDIG